ncbi:MAG: DUF5652 family protein [Minisyncoccota bacterium]
MHGLSPWYAQDYSPFMFGFMSAFLPLFILAALWTIVLKGFALWYAARGGQKGWFIALLFINTLGVLEIIYLIWFRPKNDMLPRREDVPASTSSAAQ